VKNFDMPYLAANVSAFWRRWHISLSNWLRDYVFIPLGGSRGGRWRTCRNLLLVMTLAGLWHGAAWTWLLFGLVQGLLLCGHRVFRRFCEGRPGLAAALRTAPGTALCVAFTFVVFCYSLVICRSTSLANAGTMLGRMLTGAVGPPPEMSVGAFWLATAAVAL